MRIVSKRTVLAIGSVMDFWPARGYAEFMPKGSVKKRIGQHWKTTGNHFKDVVGKYEYSGKR